MQRSSAAIVENLEIFKNFWNVSLCRSHETARETAKTKTVLFGGVETCSFLTILAHIVYFHLIAL